MKLKEKCEMLERKEALGQKKISELEEEITALRQLLDCAAANIALLVSEQGGVRRISAEGCSARSSENMSLQRGATAAII